MNYASTARRPALMTAAEAAAVERRYRETQRKVDDALERVARSEKARDDRARREYRATLNRTADVVERARLEDIARKENAWRVLGYPAAQAAELARKPLRDQVVDADGKAWQHPDREHLARWVAQRNETLRAAKASGSRPSWRSDGVVEHKAVLPESRGFGSKSLDRIRALELAEDERYWGDTGG